MMIAFVFLAAWAAFTVSAVAGGGAGLVLVPLLRAIVAIESVPAALAIGTAASSASRIALLRTSIRWDVVRRFVPTALPAAALGAWLLTRFEPAYVELLIAVFLLGNLPALLRRRPALARKALPLTTVRLALIGAAAGLISGFTGAVGLLFNAFYRRLGLTPQEIVATRAMNEVLLHMLKIMLYAAFGLIGRGALSAGLLVALAAVLASITTTRLLPHLHEAMFRRIGQAAMVAAGGAMFCLSGGQVMQLHRAWIDYVAPGDSRELRLFWRGRQHLAIELDHVWPEIERTIPVEALPAEVRARTAAQLPSVTITQVEAVHGMHGLSYEIYFKRDGRAGKIELE